MGETFTLDEIAHDDKLVGIDEEQSRKTSIRTYSPVITLSGEKLRYLIQLEVKSALEPAQREEVGSMSRNLVEETIRDVFATGSCVATEDIGNS